MAQSSAAIPMIVFVWYERRYRNVWEVQLRFLLELADCLTLGRRARFHRGDIGWLLTFMIVSQRCTMIDGEWRLARNRLSTGKIVDWIGIGPHFWWKGTSARTGTVTGSSDDVDINWIWCRHQLIHCDVTDFIRPVGGHWWLPARGAPCTCSGIYLPDKTKCHLHSQALLGTKWMETKEVSFLVCFEGDNAPVHPV